MRSPRTNEFDILLEKVRLHYDSNLPFVMYSLPNEAKVKLLLQKDATINHARDFNEKGFVFAPFDDSKEAILMPSDQYFSAGYQNTGVTYKKAKPLVGESKTKHLHLVADAIDAIKKGSLKKVVVSRTVTTTNTECPVILFTRALATYPKALCYLWFHPKVGLWLGASPEQLVHVEEDVLKTTSLAGTLPVLKDQEPQWTLKELEEQGMVTDYLKKRLHKYSESMEVDCLTSVRAGQLWHLKTNVKAHLKTTVALKDIVCEIHPSPAVCGIPKEAAKEFIMKSEGYDRSFYTGFLGELNLHGDNIARLFVNLRCMKLEKDKASIFVGGGITADSDPEMEWEETKNKCHTMLTLL